jgi:hypothetical protein
VEKSGGTKAETSPPPPSTPPHATKSARWAQRPPRGAPFRSSIASAAPPALGSRISFCGGFAALLILRAFRRPNVGGIVLGLNFAACWWVFSSSFVPARSFRSRWLAAPHTPRACRRKYQQFVFPHSFSRELLKFSGRQTEFGWQKQLFRVAMLGTLYRRGSVHFIEVEFFNSTLFHQLFPCSL